MNVRDVCATHEVLNQPPELRGVNFYADDVLLSESVQREGASWGSDALKTYGRLVDDQLLELGRQADANPPKLRAFDRFGKRIDEVDFHPAYHSLLAHGAAHGVHALAWQHEETQGAHVVRAALHFLHCQADQGTACPLTMTYACVPALRANRELDEEWRPRVTSSQYDPRSIPAQDKHSSLVGMGMTEKQGGSDLRANTSRAHPIGQDEYEIVGHKWFFSAPMCDSFLVLAQAPGGLSCFLMPRWRPDGTRNSILIQRLKDKLGNRSNASSEVEFMGAYARRLGPEGKGIATILEMVALTRLDCMTGSAAIMRQALTQAIHHSRNRMAFGKLLADQPLMRNVLADLALESEAAIALSMRVARAVDASHKDPREAAFARIATAVGKYYICKRTPHMVAEALECLGGSGYIEESVMPRLYREAPLNSIWEGCGNIQCLDVLRAVAKTPEVQNAILDELQPIEGQHPGLARTVNLLKDTLNKDCELEHRARELVESLAVALQASTLLRGGNTVVAELFCASRLGSGRSFCFGALPGAEKHAEIVSRAALQA